MQGQITVVLSEISKTVAFFMKHSGSIMCKVTSNQHRCTEIIGGFEMPGVLRFKADPAMIETLKSLLQVSETIFPPTAEGSAYDMFL